MVTGSWAGAARRGISPASNGSLMDKAPLSLVFIYIPHPGGGSCNHFKTGARHKSERVATKCKVHLISFMMKDGSEGEAV